MSDPPFRAALERGAALFAAGHWWEAHEAWEAPWLLARGPDRAFLQALILLAAALHKRWHHGSTAHRNFYKAERYLDTLPAAYAGVDLQRLRTEVWAALHDPTLRPAFHPQPGQADPG
ncbi:DUF309 domain-containing protein [Deinococcus multiflagellatus]|uniref:DUF309 domain-containing protein n=1 Tax=Deinococcus multiflagellatus TaxID=1656887 RepID=A0ABW1ZJ26_9DEIO|nr:DUF309 domain-containing protein [Deinococcus multiflagellatus]MBZ9713042.1 DUF309 domain-containing protein [Deinococcus multiflagellatus]